MLVFLAFSAVPAWAEVKDSTELIEHSRKYDHKQVVYQGEVIGDVMVRGDHAWINVNDGVNAMGIWLAADKAKSIKYIGQYKSVGDTVKLTGTFNRACRQHGGDMDIHADKLQIVKSGHPINHPIHPDKAAVASLLTIMAALLYWWERKVTGHRKKITPPAPAGDYCPYIPEEEK